MPAIPRIADLPQALATHHQITRHGCREDTIVVARTNDKPRAALAFGSQPIDVLQGGAGRHGCRQPGCKPFDTRARSLDMNHDTAPTVPHVTAESAGDRQPSHRRTDAEALHKPAEDETGRSLRGL